MKYEVIVGNIGSVYNGWSKFDARVRFLTYVEQSRSNYGRSSGENVWLLADGEPVEEFQGTNDDEEF